MHRSAAVVLLVCAALICATVGCGDRGASEPITSRGAAARSQVVATPEGAVQPFDSLSQSRRPFDVIIVGGSTAALSAALAAADEGALVALLEPTDWIGGQLTASGVPAVDEAWHKVGDPQSEKVVNVSAAARDARNMSPEFRAMLDAGGDGGDGWVSRYCFEPRHFLTTQLVPAELRRAERLVVFRNTVVKRIAVDEAAGRITGLTAIERVPRDGVAHRGYDRLPSADLADWYSPRPSERFDKRVLEFASAEPARPATFIDASEWGEALALSRAPYVQGVDTVDGGLDGDDTCGQATVYAFVQKFNEAGAPQQQRPTTVEHLGFGDYREMPDVWSRIWTYRRIKGRSPKPSPGDLSLQNWGYSSKYGDGGNDYPFGYLFKSRALTEAELADWQGGLDLAVLAAAEERALAWHEWFRQHAPAGIDPDQISLDGEALGTGHGLAKLPYIRDTRRSVGLDEFILKIDDLCGPASAVTGQRFADRVAIGAYAADIHPLVSCDYPKYIYEEHETLPFYIPFRALTNARYGNLLVAGKTMAQSFLANSATRLHPIEWSSGAAAGVAAAWMAKHDRTSRDALAKIDELQARVARYTPINWTIEEKLYPAPGEAAQ